MSGVHDVARQPRTHDADPHSEGQGGLALDELRRAGAQHRSRRHLAVQMLEEEVAGVPAHPERVPGQRGQRGRGDLRDQGIVPADQPQILGDRHAAGTGCSERADRDEVARCDDRSARTDLER